MSVMQLLRNTKISLYYWLVENVKSNYGFNNLIVTDEYSVWRDDLKPPVISINHLNTSNEPLELGGSYWGLRTFTIDIYATNKGERDDLVEIIMDQLLPEFMVYDYNPSGSTSKMQYLNDDGRGTVSSVNPNFSSTGQQLGKFYIETITTAEHDPEEIEGDKKRFISTITFIGRQIK